MLIYIFQTREGNAFSVRGINSYFPRPLVKVVWFFIDNSLIQYNMVFRGTIKAISSPKNGVSQSGKEWRAQEFVVENDEGRFPEAYVFSVFNKEIGANVGDTVEVRFDGRAREYNGRWFNDLKAYDVQFITAGSVAQTPPQPQPEQVPPPQQDDQLPF